MFYTFNQNNSGGSFVFDEDSGITHFVIIEAESIAAANEKAESIGIYFDGCESGDDCECCGDRWMPVDSYEESESPKVYGTHPSNTVYMRRWMQDGKEACIHYADGRKEWH